MEDGINLRRLDASRRPPEALFGSAKTTTTSAVAGLQRQDQPPVDFQPQNAFTSRAKTGRLFAGEPVASGVQPSGITSAIRSQMSATGNLGSKAGTSKAIHGLQRKVLQKSAPTSHDPASRRVNDAANTAAVEPLAATTPVPSSFVRSASMSQTSQRTLDAIAESHPARGDNHKRTMSVPVQPKPKRDPKPGYCENCQDKFDDFDDVSSLKLMAHSSWPMACSMLPLFHVWEASRHC